MTDKHPYISGAGALTKAIQHFRNSLPAKIDASTLKKLGLAPKNESYLINILKFLGIIDAEGVPTAEARSAFTQHDDGAFGKKIEELVKKAYSDIFSLHGEKAWSLDENALITYFRQTDQSSAVVGSRQAKTFQTLAAFSGHGSVPEVKTTNNKKIAPNREKVAKQIKAVTHSPSHETVIESKGKDFGLTVRIEINLPAGGDKDTYDAIFKSIKENILNA